MRELVVEFERRVNAKIRRQEKLSLAEKKDFRRGELPGKYIAKILYRQNNGRFKDEYLRNQKKWKRKDNMTEKDEFTSSSGSRNLEERVILDVQSLDTSLFS